MSRSIKNFFGYFLYLFIVGCLLLGFDKTIEIAKSILVLLNSMMISLFDTSLLNFLFKHIITYPLVGLVLCLSSCPRGKEGHYLGKAMYFGVGYIVAMILDNLSKVFLV